MNQYIDQFISISDNYYKVDFFEWLTQNIRIEESGTFKPFSFENHEPLKEIYGCYNHPRVTLRKAAQLGLSTFAIIRGLYLGISNRLSTGYLFPTDEDMDDFVASKLEPLIHNNPYFESLIREADVDNRGLKVFRGFSLYLRGVFSKRKVKSFTSDHIVRDELDEANMENMIFAEDRMLHSKFGYITELSQPSIDNFGIDLAFKQSDQRFWGVKCSGCNTWNFPDEIFPDCIKTRGKVVYVGCVKCSRKLEVAKGKWVAKFKDRSKLHAGFQISHLIFNVTSAEKILKSYKDISSISEKKRFTISILGKPYSDPVSQPITLEVLKNAEKDFEFKSSSEHSVCGIDVGDLCHIVIGHTKNGVLRIHWIAEMHSDKEKEIIELLKRHNVTAGLIDAGPYKTFSKNICRALDNKVWLHYIRKTDNEKKSAEGEGDLSVNRFTTDRTESLDNTVFWLQEGKIELPSYKKTPVSMLELYNMFRTHCQFLIKETVTRANGIVELQYKHNVPNHFGMALNSCAISAFRLNNQSIDYNSRFINANFY